MSKNAPFHPTRLHINVDHVATLRQARGTRYPCPMQAARMCEQAGADGITIHLREDRRHIQDDDVIRMRESIETRLNLEMALTDEMVRIALQVRPDKVTLVPEKREERTTEGGLEVAARLSDVRRATAEMQAAGIAVSLFIDPDPAQVRASVAAGAQEIELHTGDYANAVTEIEIAQELQRLSDAVLLVQNDSLPLEIAAGHGLTRENVPPLLAAAPSIVELNIGHAVVADAIFVGMGEAVLGFLAAMGRV